MILRKAATTRSLRHSGGKGENFVISPNKIYRPAGRRARVARDWRPISLSHNRARYAVSDNSVIH